MPPDVPICRTLKLDSSCEKVNKSFSDILSILPSLAFCLISSGDKGSGPFKPNSPAGFQYIANTSSATTSAALPIAI